jgi:choline dehydrogenase-like flavoprotein
MSDAERLRADAVVIGSGAGGGPVAAVLAESGRRVVVLEAGPRLEAGDFTGDEGEMTARLWRVAPTADTTMTLYAGAASAARPSSTTRSASGRRPMSCRTGGRLMDWTGSRRRRCAVRRARLDGHPRRADRP